MRAPPASKQGDPQAALFLDILVLEQRERALT